MKEKANKEIKQTKAKSEKKAKKQENKEKKPNKFIETIKKKWLIDGTKTALLVAIILLLFFAINLGVKTWDPTPIDLSQEKLYTLTDASKEKVKPIDQEVNIYFIGYSENDSSLDLAKEYGKVNSKIKAEAVTVDNRPDLAQKYGFESGNQGIIVESGERYKVLSANDLVTYDTTTYETISIAEERLTAAILSTTTDKIPHVYFLSGYSSISLDSGLQYLGMYLQNEIYEIGTVDVLTKGKIPDDCDTLVINTPTKDFDDTTTNAILDYINSGKNILWFNAATTTKNEFTNVNKVLATYGVNPFESGAIRETDASKMVSNSPDLIMPEVQSNKITKNLTNSNGVIMINATKINTIDDEQLTEQKITKTPLLQTSEKSYFRTNFNNAQDSKAEGEEEGSFLVGAELVKTITEANEETGEKAKTSSLVIYGENYFISDVQLTQSSQTPVIQYRQNKDLAINSIAALVDREEDITARKSTGTVTYTATEQQNQIILAIIFGVPAIIIVIGIMVWIKRKRRR